MSQCDCPYPSSPSPHIQFRWSSCVASACGHSHQEVTDGPYLTYANRKVTTRGQIKDYRNFWSSTGCTGELVGCSGTTTTVTSSSNQTNAEYTGTSVQQTETLTTSSSWSYDPTTKTCVSTTTCSGSGTLYIDGVLECSYEVNADCSRTDPCPRMNYWSSRSPFWNIRFVDQNGTYPENTTYTPAEASADVFTNVVTPTCEPLDFLDWPGDGDGDPYQSLPTNADGVAYQSGVGSYVGSTYIGICAGICEDIYARHQYSHQSIWKNKAEWRVVSSPFASCYLKLWLRKITTTTPPTGLPTSTSEIETVQWNGTGNPCILNPNLSYLDPSNVVKLTPIEVPVPVVANPDTKVEVNYEFLKWSAVEGYEPDRSDVYNKQPNGYPDPFWEVAAP